MREGVKDFWVETGGVCRDCGIRDILTIDGLPRRHRWYGFRLSGSCEGCGGSGRASVRVSNLPLVIETLSRKKPRPLTEKQRFVLELRHGLRDGYSYTQREVAAMMGISQEMVRKHEEAARGKIESLVLRGKKLKETV